MTNVKEKIAAFADEHGKEYQVGHREHGNPFHERGPGIVDAVAEVLKKEQVLNIHSFHLVAVCFPGRRALTKGAMPLRPSIALAGTIILHIKGFINIINRHLAFHTRWRGHSRRFHNIVPAV